MKMMYNGTPIKSLNIKHFEVSTNDCTMKASDLQAGVTGVARGKKIVGTGKAFSFVQYGKCETNLEMYVPNDINVIEIASIEYPVLSSISFNDMGTIDFSNNPVIGQINLDGSNVEISAKLENNMLTLICPNTISLEVFYGRDEYL